MDEMRNRDAVERMWECVNSRDPGDLEELVHDDFVQEWPQSGEVIRGKRNAIAIMAGYPDLPRATMRRIVGRGDLWLAETTLDYAGKTVHAISIYEFRGGKIARETDYFGDPFEPAEWRTQWVEQGAKAKARV
jgi:ketosteroid isomerase-like protein